MTDEQRPDERPARGDSPRRIPVTGEQRPDARPARGDSEGGIPLPDPPDLSHVQAMWAGDGASAHLGMEALSIEADHAVVRMTVGPDMVNGHAIAHGGYIFTLADSTFALVCNSRGRLTVAAGADIVFVASARLGDVLVAEGASRTAYGRAVA